MSEKRFIRNIVGNIYDSEKDKWFEEDWKGKPLDYDDDLIVFLNEQQDTIFKLQEIIIDLKDDKNQLHKVISKLRQEVAELKTRNSVLSSKLNQIPKSIKEVWLDE